MRILYGVQGTGNGHISRCRLMAKALQAEGVQVDYVLSGRDADAYFDMQEFGEYRCLPGLSFATKDGAIDLWATVNRSQPLQLLRDIRQLSLDDYDSIISDFEPVTAWAAKRQNRPVLGISHQAVVSLCRTTNGRHAGSALYHAPFCASAASDWFALVSFWSPDPATDHRNSGTSSREWRYSGLFTF